MFAPMLLGYALGAVGVYTLLYRFAPVRQDSPALAATPAQTAPAQTEVYTLFESEDAVRRAA